MSNQGHTMTLHTHTHTIQCPYLVSTSYTLQLPGHSLDKILKVKFTVARSLVNTRSHQDVAHLHPQTNVPTKYKHPMPHGF